jgi:hypothetical protein
LPIDPPQPPASNAPQVLARPRGRLWRAAELILPSKNASGVIFGVITMGALLAAESGRKETYALTFGSALVVMVVYWVAHAYATIVGRHLSTRETLTARTLFWGFVHDWALVRGAAIPLVVLLIAWVAGASQGTALRAAVYSVVVCLIGFELLQGIVTRARPSRLAYDVGVGLALGLGVLGLQILFTK